MNKRFEKIILHCQELRSKFGGEYQDKCKAIIEKYSKEIVDKKLIDKCTEKAFAKQLCMVHSLKYKS